MTTRVVWADLVASWRAGRVKELREAAAAARRAYNAPQITEHTNRYADDLDAAAELLESTTR